MKMTSGLFPVEGTSLSMISQEQGLSTKMPVFDNFLTWNGLPMGGLTLLSGNLGSDLARSILKLNSQLKVAWIHSLHRRPFFIESESCLRVQCPDECQYIIALRDLLLTNKGTAVGHFDLTILSLDKVINKIQARELLEVSRAANCPLIILCKNQEQFPLDYCDLHLDCDNDYTVIKKALNRPIPFWISTDMLDIAPRFLEDTANDHNAEMVLQPFYEKSELCG